MVKLLKNILMACLAAVAQGSAGGAVNFLFHMLLSGDDEQLLVGNFMGDFVKGGLEERFTKRVRQGVRLHRMIDSYAEQNPWFRGSKQRLDPGYGLYRGAMVDMFYDYFLVNSWQHWSDESFDRFLVRTRSVIDRHQEVLPDELHRFIPALFEELLPSYGTTAGIGAALSRLSRRLSRANPLAGSERELLCHHEALYDDFRQFTPDMLDFVRWVLASETGVPER